jgi:hypothetical protein
MPDDGRVPAPTVHPNGQIHALPLHVRSKTQQRVRQAMANAAARQRMKPAVAATAPLRVPPGAGRRAPGY